MAVGESRIAIPPDSGSPAHTMSMEEGIPSRVSTIRELTQREEALLVELMDLRRERIRLDRRIREVLMLQRIERGLPIHRNLEGDPSYPESPCHCLRCDYAWYPVDPTRAPKCCSRCGSTEWMLPPTKDSRKPGDKPAASWARRRSPRTKLAERAKREREAAEKAAMNIPAWRSASAPVPPPDYPWDRAPLPGLAPVAPTTALAPPPSIAAILPRPPDPATVSLSARLSQYRRQDDSPEQPERTVTMPVPATVAPSVIVEEEEIPDATDEAADLRAGEHHPAEDHGDLGGTGPRDVGRTPDLDPLPAEDHRPEAVAPAPAAEVIPEYVPAERVGAPSTDAEREELAKAQEAAWPTTKPD